MLKWLACLFMLIDHIGYYFSDYLPYPLMITLRCIGRLAFPIFAWSVARGCERTHNIFLYFMRMALFAIPTEILIRCLNRLPGTPPYPTNILITFSLAIVLVYGYKVATRSILDMIASLRPIPATHNTLPTPPRYDVRVNIGGIELDSRLGLIIGLLAISAALVMTAWLQPDYGFYGLFTVLLFFIIHERCPEKDWFWRSLQFFLLLNLLFLGIRILEGGIDYALGALIQCLSVFALPLCYRPGLAGKPGPIAKYGVYAFYPLHILFLVLIRLFLLKS